MKKILYSGLLLLYLFLNSSHASFFTNEPEFLEPDQAFKIKVIEAGPEHIKLGFTIAPNYYLYQRSIKVTASTPDAITFGDLQLPKGSIIYDPNFDQELEIFRDQITAVQTISTQDKTTSIDVQFQGCADAGLCYSPMTKTLAINIDNNVAPLPPNIDTDVDLADSIADASFLRTISLFFGLGVLLAFTPCVLPMLPILSALIVGQQQTVKRSKGLLMALAYVIGMSVVYTIAGVIAGLSGASLAASLQAPWVLIVFAILLVILSLGMFDILHIQLPNRIQSQLSHYINKLPGGQFTGVLLMGALSALIVGPCVAAPLAGALLYISKSGDIWLGGSALFAMAWGMGVPLLVLGASAGALSLKPGAWMNQIKHIFGVLLLGVAWWMLQSLLSVHVQMLGWAVLGLFFASVLGTFDPPTTPYLLAHRVKQTLGLIVIGYAMILILSVASGGASLWQPLKHLNRSGNATNATESMITFKHITSEQALNEILANTQQPVLLDFYADWCISCKEMIAFTFNDPAVSAQLQGFTRLQVDVTRNTLDDQALLKRFNLFGPPGIIFFDAQGRELPKTRVIGFKDAEAFNRVLGHVANTPKTQTSPSR